MNQSERAAFLKERLTGIGGSEAAGVCRASRWENKSPVAIYLDKLGEGTELPDNVRMRIGRKFENPLLEMYEEDTGLTLSENPGLIRHRKYPFLLAHVDGLVEGSHIVEIKMITSPHHDEWATIEEGKEWYARGDIPEDYYYQIQHYLMVTGLEEAHLYAYIASFDPIRLYKFKRNNLFILKMRAAEIDFWNNHVQKKIPPVNMTKEETLLLWPKPEEKKLKAADVEVCLEINMLKETKAQMKELKAKEKEIIDVITTSIGSTEGLQDEEGKTLVTWKENSRGSRTLRVAN